MAINTNIGPERVEVSSKPLGSIPVAGAGISTTSFIISTAKVTSPVNIPTKVYSFDEFVDLFGDADECNYDSYYAVQGFFDNAGVGNTAIIVNVGDSPTVNDFIGSGSEATGLRALDLEDNIGMVTVPGLPLAMAYLVDGAVIDYTETVRALFGNTLTDSFSLVAIPKEIKKANTSVQVGALLTVDTAIGSTITLDGAPSLAGMTAGMVVKKAGQIQGVISEVDDMLKTITVTSLGTVTASDSISVHVPSAIEYKEEVVNNPSKYAAWYFNNLRLLDAKSTATPGQLVTASPVGHVAGVIARIDANISVGGCSHAPAGLQLAGLAGIQGLELTISERVEAGPLRLNFINRLTSFPGSGSIIFGGYTADSGTSATFTADEQLIQVIRTLQFIKNSLEPGLRSYIWENFSPATQGQITQSIQSFLRNNIYLFPAGLAESSQFQVIQVEATQDELDKGLLKVRVQVRPNKAIRFIEVDLEFPLPST